MDPQPPPPPPPPPQHATTSINNAAAVAAVSASSSSSNHSSQASLDAYDQQDVSSILAPSLRSSLSTRHSSTADSSLTWRTHRDPQLSSAGVSGDGNGRRDGLHHDPGADLFAPPVTSAALPPTIAASARSTPWLFPASIDMTPMDGKADARPPAPSTTFRSPLEEPDRSGTAAAPVAAPANPFLNNNNNNESKGSSDNNNNSLQNNGTFTSLLRYRFGDVHDGAEVSASSSLSISKAKPASPAAMVPAPPQEDSTVRSSSTSSSPSQQQRPAAAAVAPGSSNSHSPHFSVDEANNNNSDDHLDSNALLSLSHVDTAAVAPMTTTPHVRFSSDLEVVEAPSCASTSTTTIAACVTPPTTFHSSTDNNAGTSAGASSPVRHAATEAHEIDAVDKGENSPGNTVNSDGNNNNSGGKTVSDARQGRSRREGRTSEHESVTPARALPLFLTPDELQLERLKAYDHAADGRSDRRWTEGRGATGHGHHTDSAGGNEGGGSGGGDDDATPRDVDVDGEDASLTHHRSPCRRSGETNNNHNNSSSDYGDLSNDGISTLDFLKDTTTTILPDAFVEMFTSATHFLKTKTETVVSAVPQPLRRAVTRTGEGIATAADMTGSMLSNVGAYAMRGVPDKVMSPEWKYLVFVDAVNVLKCSLNANILVAPYVFRMAGLVGGLLLIFIMQGICCYYTEVYFKAKNELKGADYVIMYGDVPRITFGRWYPTFQLWYDGIALVATVAYAALNMQALLPHMKITGNAAKALSFIIPSLFCLPFAFMKRASTQPPMMTLASLLIFISLVMMFAIFPYGSVVAATIRRLDHGEAKANVAVLPLFPHSAQEFFVAISICVFIFTPLSRAVPVERTMEPRRYIKLLRISVLISTVVYVAFGVCAIVSYGSLTCSVLSTSFNNHHTSVEVAVMSLLFFAFLFYIPVNMFELGELGDRRILGWRAIPRYWETGPNLLRILFLVSSALIAWCIPYYGLLIALSGCLGYSVVAIIIPAALDYVCRARYSLLRGRTPCFLDYVITFSGATLGGIICLVGVVMTSYEIWLVVQSGYSTTC